MSLTVGTPTAIGAQLILDGKISERGVIIPIYPDIYNPVLDKLAEEGIKLVDTEDEIWFDKNFILIFKISKINWSTEQKALF